MEEQKFVKIKKTLAVLLVVLFVMSVTAASVSAEKNFKSVKSSFKGDPTSGPAPLKVKFTDLSDSKPYKITSWDWDFGDGTFSTKKNPTHTYTDEGVYTVSLIVTNSEGGTATYSKKNYINVVDSGSGITCDFKTIPTSGTSGDAPLTVHFKDRSESNIIDWEWDFGDGDTSVEQNPEHEYTAPGRYTVSLTVWDAKGNTATEVKTKYIKVR